MVNVKKLARALYIEFGFAFYDKQKYDREAAKTIWDTGKYDIEDYGGDDFHFIVTKRQREAWVKKAKRLLKEAE